MGLSITIAESTPCTAPMMAGAVGYALAAPAVVTLAVFMALAIGFALPFLLIAYVPGLLSKLPKPGPWMARFKEVLSFPMFAAAIWLVEKQLASSLFWRPSLCPSQFPLALGLVMWRPRSSKQKLGHPHGSQNSKRKAGPSLWTLRPRGVE